ncbi:MAG: 3-oxoacyl-ACP synthase [Thermoanaerobaculia bacterium]|nr:3-oxoacyl-ACP synthase [Thermoanaerobaculia bacterium]
MTTDDAWIQERSGIVERRYVKAGVGSADLGAQAAQAALDDAGVGVDEVDYLVCATMTPDHYLPGSGTLIQDRLGMAPLPALDLRQQCAGFAYGLQVVDALVRSGLARTVLLVGAEVHSSLMPYSEATWRAIEDESAPPPPDEDIAFNSQFRHLLVLFGDGAGAMVFRAHEENDGRGILASRLRGDGAEMKILYTPGVGSGQRPYVSHAGINALQAVPVMEGRAVFKHAVTRMPAATLEVLEAGGYGIDDLDLLVMHQANLRINEAARKQLGLPESKVHNNIQRYGNTTAGTLPICFHEAREAGKAPKGSLVAFTALGAGLHWGSVLLRV